MAHADRPRPPQPVSDRPVGHIRELARPFELESEPVQTCQHDPCKFILVRSTHDHGTGAVSERFGVGLHHVTFRSRG